jgi:hypothetical protein
MHISGALDVHLIFGEQGTTVAENIRIGEVGMQVGAVLRQARPEQQRISTHHGHAQMGQKPRVGVEQTVGTGTVSVNVAVCVDEREGVVGLQRIPLARTLLGGSNLEALLDRVALRGRARRRCFGRFAPYFRHRRAPPLQLAC